MANVRSHQADPVHMVDPVDPVALAPVWQAWLWSGPGGVDTAGALAGARRVHLGAGAWLDRLDGWVPDPDGLLAEVVASARWIRRTVTMYGRLVDEPRLVASFDALDDTRLPAAARALAETLGAHYGRPLTSVSAALYRDGRDSVAWHGDRFARTAGESIVAVVSLGATRRFLLRPRGGGPSIAVTAAAGDLLVMGGTCQRTWQHCVPKVRRAWPRVSLMFRELREPSP